MEFNYIYIIVINFVAFFLALSVHEFSHAMAAYYLGDQTAAQSGRLTLNPLAHIDPFGTVLLPLILILSNVGIVFGWAKPVPVNYFNLRNQKWGPAVVSLAGPAANFVFGIFSIILLNLVIHFTNLGLTGFAKFLSLLIIINVILMVFNLIPIPPLDGSKVLFALLPFKYFYIQEFLERYGILILIGFLLFGDFFLNRLFAFFINIVDKLIF